MSYLLHLRTFLAVYRHNSISRGAIQLQLTQPAVSRHVKILEARLHSPLFMRLPRGLAPTPAAVELERRVATHLDALEAVIGAGVATRDALAGVIHIGMTSGFFGLILAALGAAAMRGIRLDLRTLAPPALLTALCDRELDLVITLARIPHPSVEYTLLYEGRRLLVCAPTWRDRLPKSSAPKGLPLVDLQGPVPPLASYWNDVYGTAPDMPAVVVPDYQVALEAAKAGAGLVVMPECLCRHALDTGQLIALPQPKRAPQFTLYLARAKGVAAGERGTLCRDQLIEAARQW